MKWSRPRKTWAVGLSVLAAHRALAATIAPITLTGWNQDLIADTTNAVSSTTSSFDTVNSRVFYVAGLSGSGGGGLPSGGSIQSSANTLTTFQLQAYTADSALFFNSATSVTTGQLTLATPATYTTLALLDAGANGASNFNYTLNFTDGGTATGLFSASDWFNNTSYAIEGLGYAQRTNPISGFTDNTSGATNPRLYETDLTVPTADQNKLLASVSFTQTSGNTAGIFAISGSAGATAAYLTWYGTTNGNWDTSTKNWHNGSGGSVAFSTSSNVVLNDFVTGATSLTVTPGGVTPGAVAFDNNTKSYALAGGAIAGSGGVTLNGTGSVTFSNAKTYTGATTINAGSLTLAGATGSIRNGSGAATVIVASGASFALAGTGQTAALALTNNGATTLGQSTQTIATLTGSGTLNASGGALSIGAGTYSGSITGAAPVTVTGNLSLTGASAYTGGTTVTSTGFLTAGNPKALGTNTVTLSGGTLRLASVSTLSGFSGEVLNGGPTVASNVLAITTSSNNEDRSAFTPQPVLVYDSTGFSAHFVWQAIAGQAYLADGITFILQNDPRGAAALGDGGGSLGYASSGTDAIINSGGIILDTHDNSESSTPNTGTSYAINGVTGSRRSTNGIVTSQDPVVVDLTYANSTLSETLTDQTTLATYSTSYTLDFNTLLGGHHGYLGFTGGTGDGSSTQTISNFTFTNNVPLPVSIANAVNVTAGTKSTIQIPVSLGQNHGAVGAVTINTGATLVISGTYPGTGTPPAVLTVSSLNLAGSIGAWTSTVDLASNDLDITNGNLTVLTDQVRNGYNAGGGNWTGTGITSSAAAADTTHLTAVGVIQNNQDGTPIYGTRLFDGTAPGPSDILVKYTYYGDANLDGQVDGSDYSLIDNGLAHQITGWLNGDFNYDGVINGSDYTLIDNAFNNQGLPISSANATNLVATNAGTSAVPEPHAMLILVLGTEACLGRTRRMRATLQTHCR